MISSIVSKTLDLDAFIVSSGNGDRHKLIDGEQIEMDPTDPHKQVGAFMLRNQSKSNLASS